MWDKKPGQKTNRFHVIGLPEVPLYLYRSDSGWVLIEGGITVMAPLVLEQLNSVVGDLKKIKHWFITHSHYDHCGLLPSLINHLPEVKIFASRETFDSLQKDSVAKVVNRLNHNVSMEWNNAWHQSNEQSFVPLKEIPITVLENGEIVWLDEHNFIQIIYTPGHSRCSCCYYLRPENILFVSDALGEIIDETSFLPLIFDNAEQYRDSLRKISGIDSEIIALAHHGILTHALARSAPHDAMASLNRLNVQLHENKNSIREFAQSLTDQYAYNSKKFLPRELHELSMIKMAELII